MWRYRISGAVINKTILYDKESNETKDNDLTGNMDLLLLQCHVHG